MKKVILLFLIKFYCLFASGQELNTPAKFIRLYWDNDGINALLKGQDWGYTNGIRVDYFRQQKKRSTSVFNRLSAPAGAQSITTNSWGLMQVMFTPQKTRPAIPDRNDYPYAGGLFFLYIVHSSSPVKKLTARTEWIAGIMGPASLAKQSQTFIHNVIGDPKPNGWSYQLPTDLLLNFNVLIEKRITGNRFAEIAAGGQVSAGTLQDGLSAFGVIRFQHKVSSYNGLPSQFFSKKKKQAAISLSLRPSADLVLYNAFLDGGLFNSQSPVNNKSSISGTDLKRNKLIAQLDCMLLFSWQHISLSFSQKMISPEFRGYDSHNVGNVSLYFGW